MWVGRKVEIMYDDYEIVSRSLYIIDMNKFECANVWWLWDCFSENEDVKPIIRRDWWERRSILMSSVSSVPTFLPSLQIWKWPKMYSSSSPSFAITFNHATKTVSKNSYSQHVRKFHPPLFEIWVNFGYKTNK